MSRQYFDFSSLISDFSNTFTVVTRSNDYNDAGVWEGNQQTRTEHTGAVIAFRESKVFRPEGGITAKDRRLFMQQRLPQALIGAEVEYQGQKYMIESELENAEFTGVYSYMLRWVSAFD